MSCPMTVQTLLEGWREDVPDVVITGMSLDSRRIEPGHAFVAVAGGTAHGLAFAREAQARGAVVVIHDGLAAVPGLKRLRLSSLDPAAVDGSGRGPASRMRQIKNADNRKEAASIMEANTPP